MPSAGTANQTPQNGPLQVIPIEDVDPERLALTLQKLFGKEAEVYVRTNPFASPDDVVRLPLTFQRR